MATTSLAPWEVSFEDGSGDIDATPAQAHAVPHSHSGSRAESSDDEDDEAWREGFGEKAQTLVLDLDGRDRVDISHRVISSLLPLHTRLDLTTSLHALGRDGAKALLAVLDTEAKRWVAVRTQGESVPDEQEPKRRRRQSALFVMGKIIKPFDPLATLFHHLTAYANLTTLDLHSHTMNPQHVPLFSPLLPRLATLALTACSFPHPSTLPALLSLLALPSHQHTHKHKDDRILAKLSFAGSSFPPSSEGDVLDAILPLLSGSTGTGLTHLDLSGMSPSVVPTRAAFHRMLEAVQAPTSRIEALRLDRADRAREDDLWEVLRGVLWRNRRRAVEGGW